MDGPTSRVLYCLELLLVSACCQHISSCFYGASSDVPTGCDSIRSCLFNGDGLSPLSGQPCFEYQTPPMCRTSPHPLHGELWSLLGPPAIRRLRCLRCRSIETKIPCWLLAIQSRSIKIYSCLLPRRSCDTFLTSQTKIARAEEPALSFVYSDFHVACYLPCLIFGDWTRASCSSFGLLQLLSRKSNSNRLTNDSFLRKPAKALRKHHDTSMDFHEESAIKTPRTHHENAT